MVRRTADFQTIRSEGGLLPPDLLRRVLDPKAKLDGTRPEDYGLPQGERLNEALVRELAAMEGLVVIAGRYEGVDERLVGKCIDREVSIGDYVTSGGELPAMVMIDCIVRRLPGSLNDAGSASEDSFAAGLLDWPHYTRPQEWKGVRVPEVLLSGNHAAIAHWRRKQALGRTWDRRRELLDETALSKEDRQLLDEYRREQQAAQQQQ